MVSALRNSNGFSYAKFEWFQLCEIRMVSAMRNSNGFSFAKFEWFQLCEIRMVSALQNLNGFSFAKFEWFQLCEIRMVSALRNYVIVIIALHCTSCTFYYSWTPPSNISSSRYFQIKPDLSVQTHIYIWYLPLLQLSSSLIPSSSLDLQIFVLQPQPSFLWKLNLIYLKNSFG